MEGEHGEDWETDGGKLNRKDAEMLSNEGAFANSLRLCLCGLEKIGKLMGKPADF
jgi:hypothetical protein